MPTPLSLRIPDIPGSSEKEGREDTIDIFEADWNIGRPYDTLVRSTRIHAPQTVWANIDKATPALIKACATGRILSEVILEYYRIDPKTRAETKYYEVTLRQAQVVSVRVFVPNTLKPENESLRHMVVYSFAYEEIEWKYIPDSMVETDRWQAPKESGSASN